MSTKLEAETFAGKSFQAWKDQAAKVYSCSEQFCLYYTINCPLCAAIRQH